MTDFTPISAVLGGALIGLAATLFLLMHGKIAGVSGLFGAIVRRDGSDRRLGLAFVAGLVLAGGAVRLVAPSAFETTWSASLPLALIAGVLVGFGTQLGNGCTSGHGVCGVSRLSIRSLVATLTFMAAGFATVFVVRHVLGAAS
jgi:uncharacterized membrane protein YedE/YeeE